MPESTRPWLLDRYDHNTADALLNPIKERELSRRRTEAQLYPWISIIEDRIDPDSTVRLARELLSGRIDAEEPRTHRLRSDTASLLARAILRDELVRHEENRTLVRSLLQINPGREDD